MMAKVIAAAKMTQMEVIKIISPSMGGAKLDASGGYNGNCDCTALVCSLKFRVGRMNLAAPGNPNPSDKQKNSQNAAQANDPEDGSAVLRARGIVVVTKQQDVIDGRANLSRGSVHQAKAHIAARIFDAIKVTRDAAARGQEHYAAGVGE